jgi:hypothetical protein
MSPIGCPSIKTSPAYAGQSLAGSTAFELKHGQEEIVKEFV